MGLEYVRLPLEVTSRPGFITNGDPVKIAGLPVDVQFYCPIANLIGLEVSNDRATWHFATDADGADIDGPTVGIVVDDFRTVREQPGWMRLTVWFDNGGPRVFRALVGVHKRTD